ncbi:type II toxin-antitoxin system mRNA interferase toxin, RelE/StbE family, partial [Candidatus Microgenomates bacterium]|nr:type II toxin-antitoxin system mRNA interferase toxin, RelE/StbE family [Candidatus Microgenomates bacterium]
MTVRFDPGFLNKLKKSDVRIRKSFKQKLAVFIKDPQNPQLNNHPLKRNYLGYRSIDITSNWRAIFSEKKENGSIVAFFVGIGTHEELYK